MKKVEDIKKTITVAYKKNMGLAWPMGKIDANPEDV